MWQYRIVTHVDGYQVEVSPSEGQWTTCSKVYLTKFFAVRYIKGEVARDKRLIKRIKREDAFVKKVVYGPYP